MSKLWGSVTPGMALSSGHQVAVPNCSAFHSSHVSTSETEGSGGWSSTLLAEFALLQTL